MEYHIEMKMKDSIGYGNENWGDSTIRVIGEKIKPEVFQEFYDLLELSDGIVAPADCTDILSRLVALAKSGTIEAFREVERMIGSGKLEASEADFALVALNYCRFRLENDLLDIETEMISGGLGGKDNRLRYYVALTCREGLLADHLADIRKIFSDILNKYDSVLEEVNYRTFYVSLIILGSIDFAIGNMLDEGLHECLFLSPEYYLTNVEIPTDERIKDWLAGKLDDES